MTDEERKALQRLADASDRAAAGHGPSCPAAKTLRQVSGAIRASLTSHGPAQVATDSYRDNWETLFGKRQVVGQA